MDGGWATVLYDYTAPTITVSNQSCSWRNTAINTTITVEDPEKTDIQNSGLSSSNSYQYYLSNSATSLSGGTWTNYTSGQEITLNPGVSGTYYLFIKTISDNAGNVSTTGGTATTVSGTTYQRYGAYQFDYTAPVPGEWLRAGPNLENYFYTNQSSVTLYAKAGTDDHSGIGGVNINGWYGSSWVEYNNFQSALYDSANDRYYYTYQLDDLVNTTTGSTNQGEGIYSFDYYVYDNVGNTTNGR